VKETSGNSIEENYLGGKAKKGKNRGSGGNKTKNRHGAAAA